MESGNQESSVIGKETAMNKTWKRVIIAVLVIAFLVWGSKQFTVVNTEKQTAVLEAEKFDRVAYVDAIWDSKLIPALQNDSKDLATVLNALSKGLEETKDYAMISVSGAYNFRVKGTGTVESVDVTSQEGKAIIKVDGYDGNIKVILNIGPKINGESIRDGAGFINFGDFKDQTEYGQVSKELNTRAGKIVSAALDWANMTGKRISFAGMFTIKTTNQTNLNIDTVTITPVIVEGID
jgi:predicted lipoprotein